MDPNVLLDHLDVGVLAIAAGGAVTAWNRSAARATGLPRERVLGNQFWVLFPSLRGTPVEEGLHAVRQDGQPRTYLAPGFSPQLYGMVFEVRITRGPSADGDLVLLFHEVKGAIDPASRAAQILRAFESERRTYRHVFEGLPLPALILTGEGRIVEANQAAAELLRIPAGESPAGRSLAEWLPAEQRDTMDAALRTATHHSQRLHLTPTDKDGALGEVDAIIASLDPDRANATFLCLALDASREILLQHKLLRTDRLAQLGALVSGVAHELNNPLAAIAGFAELLTVDAPSPELRESAEIIHTEALRAGRVIQTLLDFARQRPRTLQAVDLKDVTERVVALQRSALKKSRAQTTIDLPPDVPAVAGDPQELQQVVLNAIVNAREAIESTGRPGRITIAARRTDDHVVFSVEDTGRGVPPELLNRVFEPFFTTKGEHGTGLGLAISFGLVKAMGGRIWIQNTEGGGARLTMELPSDIQSSAPEARAGFRHADRPLTVLVVEDESSVRRGMALMAQRLGHRVRSAAGFREARQLLEAQEAFDALLVDVHLDDVHTGFDLFDVLRAEGQGRERHVVFTTGDSISAQTRDRLHLSERPVLKKPFNLEELREILDRVADG